MALSFLGLTQEDYIDSSEKAGFCYKCGLLASGHCDRHLWKVVWLLLTTPPHPPG